MQNLIRTSIPARRKVAWPGLTDLRERFWGSDRGQLAVLLACTLLVYLKAASFDFVLHDDPEYVYANPHVRSGLSVENVGWAFRTLHGGISYWHPVTWLSHQADCQFFGLRPGAHHLTNVWLHAANTLWVWLIARQLRLGRRSGSFIAGLFALHPLHVESVAWISERKDVLYGFFWLASLSLYLRFRERGSWIMYATALGSFGLALMSKPTAITLPLILLLLEGLAARTGALSAFRKQHAQANEEFRSGKRRAAILLPFILLALVSGMITWTAQTSLGAVPSLERWPLPDRIDNAIVSYGTYLAKALIPTGLSVSYIQLESHDWTLVLTAAVFLVSVTTAACLARRRMPWVSAGWGWFLLTLLPNIGLIQAGPQCRADRYTYLPLLGVFIALTTVGKSLLIRWKAIGTGEGLGLAVLGLCGVLSFQQLQYWRESAALFARAVALQGNNWVARLGLGMALTQERRFDEALLHLQYARTLPGNAAETERRLAVCYQWMGNPDLARDHLLRALELNPQLTEARTQLAELRRPAASVSRADEGIGTHGPASAPHGIRDLSSNQDLASPEAAVQRR